MCPLLAQLKTGSFSIFFAAAVYSTTEANKASLKQSIILRCLCLLLTLINILFFIFKTTNYSYSCCKHLTINYTREWNILQQSYLVKADNQKKGVAPIKQSHFGVHGDPEPTVIKLFCPSFTKFPDKLECLFLARFSSLV